MPSVIDYKPLGDISVLYCTDKDGQNLTSDDVKYTEGVLVVSDSVDKFCIVDTYVHNEEETPIKRVITMSKDADGEFVGFSDLESKIIKYVKSKLGYPVVNVELTLGQFKECIQEALDEISPWVVQPHYITLPYSSKIDTSKYNISYVINVIDANASQFSNLGTSGNIDVFDTQFSMSMQSYSPYQSILYSSLELGLMSRISSDIKGTSGVNWTWIRDDKALYVDTHDKSTTQVTIEYSPRISCVEDLDEELYMNFMKKFTLAFCREVLVSIRGKYKVSGSPTELDSSEQDSKSSSELDRLRSELRDTVSTHFIID